MNKPIVRAEKITKTFTTPAPLELLLGIDLTLYEGQSVAIMGKSGEGKTTLLHILGTLEEPTSGTLWFNEEVITSKGVERLRNRHFGFVFQAFHLLNECSTLENLLMPLQIAREDTGPHSAGYQRALHLLDRVGLSQRKSLASYKLSGGEKQRLGLARAFMCNPDIIFADEPTGNLDHHTALEIQELLFSWVREEKKTLLLVTHSQDLARTCDEVYVLENGYLQRSN